MATGRVQQTYSCELYLSLNIMAFLLSAFYRSGELFDLFEIS